MEFDIVRIWATPSTLHLRLVYGPDSRAWIRSKELHIGWTSVPASARLAIAQALEQDNPYEDPQDALPGL